MYAIGDRVCVVECSSAEDRKRRERDIWVAAMDDCQGMFGVIEDIKYAEPTRFYVKTENDQRWWYRENWLTPYEEVEIDPIGSISELFM